MTIDDKTLDDIEKNIRDTWEVDNKSIYAIHFIQALRKVIQVLRAEREVCKIYKKEVEDTLCDLVKERGENNFLKKQVYSFDKTYRSQLKFTGKLQKDKKVLIELSQRTQGIAEMVMPDGIINPTTLYEDVSRVLKKVKE